MTKTDIFFTVRDDDDSDIIHAKIETTDPIATLKLWRGWYDRKTDSDPKPTMIGSWNGGAEVNGVQGFAADFIHRMVAEAANSFSLLTEKQYTDGLGEPGTVSVIIYRGNGNKRAVPIMYAYFNAPHGTYEGPLHKFAESEIEWAKKIKIKEEEEETPLDKLHFLRDYFNDGVPGDAGNVGWWAIETAVNAYLGLSKETILKSATTTVDRAVKYATAPKSD